MSNPPSPPRRYIPTSSAPEDYPISQEAGRGAHAPPQSRPESTTAFRREAIPASAAIPSPSQYQPVSRALFSPVGPPPTLGQSALLGRAEYFPQRAAISSQSIGPALVQTEIGRPAQAALRGARSSRRGKTHVQKACINCKKAHLSCDAQRPCARCVASGKQDTCQDVEHKKRGRPRLRDDRDSRQGREIAAAAQGGMLGEAQGGHTSSFPPGHRRTQSGRILRSHRASVGQMVQPVQPDPRLTQRHTITGAGASQPSPYSPRRGLEARIFMNLNLRIVRANQQFRDQFAPGGDLTDRQLNDFVDRRHEPDIQRLATDLRNEREVMEPLSLPTIYSDEETRAIEGINEAELGAYTAGSRERGELWTFVQAGRQLITRQMYIQLGKVGSFPFVVLTLPHYGASSLPSALPAGHMNPFSVTPAVPQIPPQYEPVYQQRSPGGYPQTGSGPSTPSLSLQSLASSLPPTSVPVTAYGLSSARFDLSSGGYFPAQPRTQPSTQPPPPGFDPTARFGQPPSLYSTSSRPTSTVSEPLGTTTGSTTSGSRPISYPGQPRSFHTMQAESEGSPRTPGEGEGQREGEDDDARKRRRLNIREITD
ncbi:hypothetical protein NA57DRAFT_80076 [Rhizodiscina lignyota]|uniref:Zn(2)-C6 fungal-type domain-containing protein n=1 Tax=Rhizodiscina lignyota TaxID=1504668 RepID=A0A9P4IAC4_9PEZI|nr:hypothetical protein NA57DRAFT_80076 [Rhizodiscina lignyota]